MNLKLTDKQQLQNSGTQIQQKCVFFLFRKWSKIKRERILNQFIDTNELKNVKDSCEVI